jgi:hypothetical protein
MVRIGPTRYRVDEPLPLHARALLNRISPDTPTIGAEIGVFQGRLSLAILRERPLLQLYLVDLWDHSPQSKSPMVRRFSRKRWDRIYTQAHVRLRFAGERACFVRADSVVAAESSPPLDFVFIDDDHSSVGCKRSLEAWYPKIKPGGWLGGHDYHSTGRFPGVYQAVTQFCKENSLDIKTDIGHTYFVKVPI